MSTSRRLILALVLTVIPGAGVQAQSEHAPHFLTKQCNEDAIALRLDPGAFADLLGSRFSLALDEGKARVLIVVHDCGQYWMDGVDVGPTQETQVWLAIRGVEDVRPVVGAERTLPTRTWLNLVSGSNNPRVRAAKGASGTVQLPIEGVSLDPPGPKRGGRLAFPGGVEFSWAVVSVAPPVRLVGINHDVLVRDSAGQVVLNRVQALLHVTAAPSSGTLRVVGQLPDLPWIHAGAYPAVIQTFFPMWSRATLGLEPSRERTRS